MTELSNQIYATEGAALRHDLEVYDEYLEGHRYHFWMTPGGASAPNLNYPLCVRGDLSWRDSDEMFLKLSCCQQETYIHRTMHVTIRKDSVSCRDCLELLHA